MARSTSAISIGFAASVSLFAVVAGQEPRPPELTELQMIPGASSLGWVEVMRRLNGHDIGWHCQGVGGSHLHALSRLREGRARIPPHIAEKGFRAIFDYQARQGKLPEIDAETWTFALGAYLRDRLTNLSEHGEQKHRMPKATPTWRGWLRDTLEKINVRAEREGMSSEAKRRALRNWVTCHVSEVEAEQIRQLIHDNLEIGGQK